MKIFKKIDYSLLDVFYIILYLLPYKLNTHFVKSMHTLFYKIYLIFGIFNSKNSKEKSFSNYFYHIILLKNKLNEIVKCNKLKRVQLVKDV